MPEEVPAGTLRGDPGCGCHFWPPLHPLPRCPGCRAPVLAVLHPSRSQHLPGLVQPRSLKCKRALGSLNNSPSVWSCNDWPLPRTSWRQFQKPSQLAHPQMSSGSEQNLIFPLQGEEERWKNRVRYARTRKNHSPSLPAPTELVFLLGTGHQKGSYGHSWSWHQVWGHISGEPSPG